MNAPDWSHAPKWARFAAMDSSGAWWWYAEEPACSPDLGIWTAGGNSTAAHKFPGWQESLTGRPRPVRMLAIAGAGYEAYLAGGWTDEQLVEHGFARYVS